MVARQQCAFIQFTKRQSAEVAAEKTFNKLVLGGQKLSIKWAHSQAKSTATKTNRNYENTSHLSPQPQMTVPSNDYFNLAPTDVNVMPPGLKLNQLPPSMMSMQTLYQNPNNAFPAPYSSIPLPTNMPPNAENLQIPAPPINYPSQDPNRLGAIKK